MSDDLRATARAYRKALEEEAAAKEALAAAQAHRSAAGRKVAKTRAPLAEAIVKATRAGMRQKDILDAIGNIYTRERVRQICRAAGVVPPE